MERLNLSEGDAIMHHARKALQKVWEDAGNDTYYRVTMLTEEGKERVAKVFEEATKSL